MLQLLVQFLQMLLNLLQLHLVDILAAATAAAGGGGQLQLLTNWRLLLHNCLRLDLDLRCSLHA